jgi:hypothetical protein
MKKAALLMLAPRLSSTIARSSDTGQCMKCSVSQTSGVPLAHAITWITSAVAR